MINWANIKSVVLHSGLVFLGVIATNLVVLSSVQSYDAAKALVVSAISAAVVAVLHYLAGFIPNSSTSANRAAAKTEA